MTNWAGGVVRDPRQGAGRLWRGLPRRARLVIVVAPLRVYGLGMTFDNETNVVTTGCERSETTTDVTTYRTRFRYTTFAVRSELLGTQFFQWLTSESGTATSKFNRSRNPTFTRSENWETARTSVAGIRRPAWRPPAETLCPEIQ